MIIVRLLSVPVCVPHTDRYTPPQRNYRTVTYRPMPESSVRKFGEWIVTEGWEGVIEESTPSEQVNVFENIIQEKLNYFCPEKTVRITSQDKLWISGELKRIHRLKGREYNRRGKTQKYKELAKQFKVKHKIEAEKYLRKGLQNWSKTRGLY